MSKQVTKAQAEQVLAAVKAQYGELAADQYGPKLVMDFDYLGTGPTPTVVWEEGPYEWAYTFPEGGVDEEATTALQEFAPGRVLTVPEAKLPAGVWVEPMTSWAVSIYPS